MRTFLFSFIVLMAYVVGSRLSRFQALAVSTLYAAATVIGLLSILNSMGIYQGILEQSEFLQRQVLISGDLWSLTIGPVLANSLMGRQLSFSGYSAFM